MSNLATSLQTELTSPPAISPQEALRVEAQMELDRRRAAADYKFFMYQIFPLCFDEEFVGGKYIDWVIDTQEQHTNTIDVSARDHFKSTRLYARAIHALLKHRYTGTEGHYFSYNDDLAAYHLKKVKRMVKRNPYFAPLIDLKPRSEGVLAYAWPMAEGGIYPELTFTPGGLLAFKRGIHADYIFIDDPLRDPENKVEPTAIYKINRIMKQEVLSMPKRNAECRIVGTPQTKDDFYFDPNMATEFKINITPAEVNVVNQVALWPEFWPWDRLQRKKALIGQTNFDQEYNCVPAYEAQSYLDREATYACVNPDLGNRKNDRVWPDLQDAIVLAGLDIGKKSHPSHFAVFKLERYGDIITYRQLHNAWLEKWDYLNQLEYCRMAIRHFNISVLRYDNTRGEFEAFAEQGKLPKEMEPVVHNTKTQNSMAVNLEGLVNTHAIELLNAPRQINQMLAVNRDLKAVAGVEGHGDSFWSVAMAVLGFETGDVPNIRSL